jgi:hypothetical protein
MKFDLKQIQDLIEKCWGEDTAYYDFLWCKNNNHKSSGQCRITALLIQELFGGDIVYSHVKGNNDFDHYWNLIGGIEIDLTFDQFEEGTIFATSKKISREQTINNDKRTIETYSILKTRFESMIKK